MQDLKEDKLEEVIIDFEGLRSKRLDEGVYK